MTQNRREMLRQILGGSALGVAALASSAACAQKTSKSAKQATDAKATGQPFYVICHGMMLCELVQSASPGLILHLPEVPPMGGDAGHIYKAGSWGPAGNPKDLTPRISYSLSGLADNNQPPCPGIVDTENLVFRPTSSCPVSVNTQFPHIQISLPFPQSYLGWRYTFAQQGKVLFSGQSCASSPTQIYSTHIFVYTADSLPVMTDNQNNTFWASSGASDNKLHIFAQPPNPYTAKVDHSVYLDGQSGLLLPAQNPQVVKDNIAGHTETAIPGFSDSELVEWNEHPTGPGEKHAASRAKIKPAMPLPPFLTNCRTDFLIRG